MIDRAKKGAAILLGIFKRFGDTGKVYNKYTEKSIPPSVETEVATLDLPAGTYVITAKFSWSESLEVTQNMTLAVGEADTDIGWCNHNAIYGGKQTITLITSKTQPFTVKTTVYSRHTKNLTSYVRIKAVKIAGGGYKLKDLLHLHERRCWAW